MKEQPKRNRNSYWDLLRGNSSGVTLIELVVVATLVAILSGVLYGVLSGLLRARDETEKIRDAETTAHYLFARMTRELSSTSKNLTTLSNNSSLGGSSSSSSISAPAQTGLGNSPSVYFEGTNSQSVDSARDAVRFISSNAAQPFVDGPANYGTVEIRYSLQETSSDEALRAGVAAQKTKSGKSMVLLREEVPAAINNNDNLLKKRRIVLPLAGNVVSMNFRYLKDGKWKNEWKEVNPPLPEALEITLGLEETNGEVAYYRTAVPISPRIKNRKAPAASSTP